MAEPANPIFNKQASEKLRSPDDLDNYVRVTTPSAWIILIACIALLLGLFAWAFFGAISTSVSTTAASVDGKVICLLSTDDAAKVDEGDAAYIENTQMKVAEVSQIPLSREEIHDLIRNDYLVSALTDQDWAYLVTFSGEADLAEHVPYQMSITTERVAPIELVLGKTS